MGPIGFPETILIFIVALLLFGPKELPKIGKTVAKAINDFKRASNELKDTWQRELTALEHDTQDIRSEITQETKQLTDTTSSYGESYYNQDSSYDYGAYGYPDTSSNSTAETATSDVSHPVEAGEGHSSSEAPSSTEAAGTGETHPPAASDSAPIVTAAQGTVPTQHTSHPTESATRDDVSSL